MTTFKHRCIRDVNKKCDLIGALNIILMDFENTTCTNRIICTSTVLLSIYIKFNAMCRCLNDFYRQLSGQWCDVGRSQRCIFNGLQISRCCATIFTVLLMEGLEYLMDVFQFNLYANCRNSHFHAFFQTGSDDLATGSDDLLGSIGFSRGQKPFLENGGGAQMLLRSPKGIIGVFLAFMVCFTTYVFSLCHCYGLVVNINFDQYELCLTTPICARWAKRTSAHTKPWTTQKNTDHQRLWPWMVRWTN